MSALNHSFFRRASAWCIAMVLPIALSAEPAQLISVAEHAQWQAIGRVNQAGYKSQQLCTGTLVAPDWVLTAAHCLISDRASPFIFAAGWLRGEAVAAREIVEVVMDPAFRPTRPVTDASVSLDIALARLASPITQVDPIPIAVLPRLYLLGQVDLMAYSGTRPHMLSAQRKCDLRRSARLVGDLACFAQPGNSGGPLLRQSAQGWDVVGVVSAGRIGRAMTKASLMRDALAARLAAEQ